MSRTLRTACVLAAAGAMAFAASFFIAPYPVAGFDDLRASWRASDAWLLDRSGEPLSRIRIDHQRRRGAWVPAAEISPALTSMVLASEDKRFREHAGVDWLALPGAIRQTLAGERRGGSTLTMQLAAYLNPALESGGRRSVLDKWRQMRQAFAIERRWRKAEILEAWLNLTPFRGEVEGVDAAARTLYGKRAQGLDRVESAVLAALVRAPNAAGSRVARRACALLSGRGNDERERPTAAQAEHDCLIAQGLCAGGLRAGRLARDLDGAAPHLARKLLERAGERVTSTLDARLQRFAVATLQRHIRELEGRHVEDGALVVLDNETGEVLAWIGSSGELSVAREVDGVLAPRQAGSTLKPFLYALAIGQRLLTAGSVLDDSPLAVTLPTGLYVPQNYDHSFKGQVSLRQALASSLNVPAVRTLTLMGYEPFYRELIRLGFETLTRDADHYGYSLALGGAEVTLLQLTNAYRALANGGRAGPISYAVRTERNGAKANDERSVRPAHSDPKSNDERSVRPERSGAKSNDERPVGPEPSGAKSNDERSVRPERSGAKSKDERIAIDYARAAYIVSDILADSAARALTFGLASPLATRYRASVKTGTSKDMRDNWAVGYAGRYTVGVWVGNFSGAPMHDVSGVDGAAPIWRDVMDFLQDGAAPGEVQAPEGLVRRRITYAGMLEPGRDEWFIEGTERSTIVALPAQSVRPHIETPAHGAIYAIDPDIPGNRQRLRVTARGAPRGARFVLEDGRQARADRPLMWLPQPGRHEVVLKGTDGKELDRVRFEVRGLPGRRKAAIGQ